MDGYNHFLPLQRMKFLLGARRILRDLILAIFNLQLFPAE